MSKEEVLTLCFQETWLAHLYSVLTPKFRELYDVIAFANPPVLPPIFVARDHVSVRHFSLVIVTGRTRVRKPG